MYKTSKRTKLLINDPNYRLENTPNVRTIDEVLQLIDGKSNASNSNSSNDEILVSDSPQTNTKQIIRNTSKRSLSFSPDFTQNSSKSYRKSGQSYKKKSKTGELSSKSNDSNSVNSYDKKNLNFIRKGSKRVFQVIWGKHKPYKKHKEWNGDGFLAIESVDNDLNNNRVHLYNINGKSMGSSKGLRSDEEYEDGKRLVVAGNEVEIQNEVSVQEFESGMFFVESD